jgi:hypothetical protein
MSQVDILNLDSKIKRMFKDEEDNIPQLEEKLLDYKKTCSMCSLSDRTHTNLKNNIKELEKKIQYIKTDQKLNFYILESAHLLENYKEILKTPLKLSFMGKMTQDNKKKMEVIKKYLEIAKKYVSIEMEFSEKQIKVICNNKNCSNKKLFDVIDNSIYICLLCGSQQEILLHTSSYKDIDRVNISVKYTYDRKVHFRDCINQYQGKQNCTIDPEVYEKLEDQFQKHDLLVGTKKTLLEKRFVKITKEHIHMFLKELDFTKHYENVNLIHYQMTGKKPDDISYLEDRLLEDFDILADLYDKEFKNKSGFDRKNFINTQYVLFNLLLKYRHPCRKEDFTILKTVERKAFHDSICLVLFTKQGWSHVPSF